MLILNASDSVAVGSWIARLDNRSSLKGIGAIGQVLKDEGDDGRPERKATAVTQKAWLTDRDGRLIVKHVFKLGSAEYAKAATCEGLQSLLCDRVDPRLRCANHTREPSVVKSTRHGTRRDYYTAASKPNASKSSRNQRATAAQLAAV